MIATMERFMLLLSQQASHGRFRRHYWQTLRQQSWLKKLQEPKKVRECPSPSTPQPCHQLFHPDHLRASSSFNSVQFCFLFSVQQLLLFGSVMILRLSVWECYFLLWFTRIYVGRVLGVLIIYHVFYRFSITMIKTIDCYVIESVLREIT